LREHLVFKGGTALKRCYFGDYRFSEDLDFTLAGDLSFKSILSRLENRINRINFRIIASALG
jgi:predicted nucleotidyltransferase component of viral defense system